MSTTANNQGYDVGGIPRPWRHIDVAGLKAARFRYVEGLALDDVDLGVLREYCAYFTAAPTWQENQDRRMVARLSDAAAQIETRDELQTWLRAAWVLKLNVLDLEVLPA